MLPISSASHVETIDAMRTVANPPGAASPAPVIAHALTQHAPYHGDARDGASRWLKRFLAPKAMSTSHPLAISFVDEDNDAASRKRKQRFGLVRKRLFHLRQRGKFHPAAMDDRYRRVFPVRDQDNQLYVHPELADAMDRTLVDRDISLLAVSIDKDDAAMISQDIAMDLFPGRLAGRDLSEQEQDIVNACHDKLIAGLHASLVKAARGEEPVPPDEVHVRVLDEHDLGPGEAALKGQYGLFNRCNADGQWRSVTEGKHLCFFSGFYCLTKDEYNLECKRHPKGEIDAYALMIGDEDYPCICPYGGGDLGQFANSALRRDAHGRMREDEGRTNTRFARAYVTLEDNRPGRHGRHLAYPVVFLYMLATPAQDGMTEREARVWYGQQYWDGFAETADDLP